MASSNWPLVRLGDLVSIKHGWAFKSEHFSTELSDRPIVVSVGNFRYTGGFRFEESLVKEYRDKYPEEFELHPGDILLVMTCQTEGGEILGIPATVPDDGRTYLHNQRLGKVELKGKVNPRYLYWLFLTRDFNRELCASATGTKIVHTAPGRIEAFRFRLPEMLEQGAIASVLDALDSKIELNRNINQTLEAMARALFKSWFIDFDPLRGSRDPLGLFAREHSRRFVSSPIGEIPEKWKIAPLGDLLSVLETGSRPRGGVKGIASGVPSVGAESIVGVGRFDFLKTKFVPEEFYDSMGKGRVQERDVLLYKDGGRPGEFEPHVSLFGEGFPFPRFCINEHVYRLRAAHPLTQTFLYFSLDSERLRAEMRVKGTGVAIPGLNTTAVRSLTILVPPADVNAAFEKLVAPWVTQILVSAAESKMLGEVRDFLLPRLLSGEMRVRDAERVVEAAT